MMDRYYGFGWSDEGPLGGIDDLIVTGDDLSCILLELECYQNSHVWDAQSRNIIRRKISSVQPITKYPDY